MILSKSPFERQQDTVGNVGAGSIVLGQDQECYGGCFSPQRAFYGDVALVRIWNKVLSQVCIALLPFFFPTGYLTSFSAQNLRFRWTWHPPCTQCQPILQSLAYLARFKAGQTSGVKWPFSAEEELQGLQEQSHSL